MTSGKATMKLRTLAASIALSLAGTSAMAATCSSTTNWGNLGPPGLELFGNSFRSATASFTDCYTFSLTGAANSFGGLIEFDTWLNKLDIDVMSVSLYMGSSLLGSDNSPLSFSFGGLSAGGAYTLAIAGSVTNDPGLWKAPVGYAGLIATIAAPVPEPAAYALMVAGLLGVGTVAWRRKKA
jgi:hypothetical protein